MLCRVLLVRNDVSEERIASNIRVTMGELGATLAVTGISSELALVASYCWRSSPSSSSQRASVASYCWHSYLTDSCHPDDGGGTILRNSVLTRATQRNIPEGDILHSHCRENHKSYKWQFVSTYNFSVRYSVTGVHVDLYYCICLWIVGVEGMHIRHTH
jgi:hypothetical protein